MPTKSNAGPCLSNVGQKQSFGAATDTTTWTQSTRGKQWLNRTLNYGSKGLQRCEIRIIKMTTITVLHDANCVRFDNPMEVNMNSTVLAVWYIPQRRYITTSPHGLTYPKTGFQLFLFIVTSTAHMKIRKLTFANCDNSGCCKGDEMNDRWIRVGWWYGRIARGWLCVAERTWQRQYAHHSSDLWITMLRRALRTAGILQKLESRRMV
jgi:hypothetical protein